MKMQVTQCFCDRCGAEIPMTNGGYYTAPDGEYAFIGVKAMFSNCGVGSKYDLCPRCTTEIAKQFIEKMEDEK